MVDQGYPEPEAGAKLPPEPGFTDTPNPVSPFVGENAWIDRFIGETECKAITSLSRTTRWRLEKQRKFPGRRNLSPNRCAWLLSEVLAWQRERAAA